MTTTPAPAAGNAEHPADDLRRDLLAVWRHWALWVALWVVTRAVIFADWAEHHRFIWNDVRYYWSWMSLGDRGANRLVEYPVPVLWILGAITLPARDVNDYVVLFALTMAALDGVFSMVLYRSRSMRALLFWIVFVLAFGGLLWFRYDMVPALVVGLAALWVTKHPRVAGALVAVGAAVKLWPALLIAPLVGRSKVAQSRLIWFGITGFTLALISFAQGGAQRLVSPLTWQSDRGLQIEAVPATWLMSRRVHSDRWRVEFSKFNAYEIYGPGVETWMRIADLLMVAVVLCAVAMGALALLRRALPADVLALGMVAVVAGMLVANKTFSPQYLVWLAAPVAALLVLAKTRRMFLLAAGGALVCIALAWLTHEVYPERYAGYVGNPNSSADAIEVLVARNALMALFWVVTQVAAIAAVAQCSARGETTGADSARTVGRRSPNR